MHTLVDFRAVFEPTGLITWLFIGLIAGFFASVLIRGRGYGCIGNIIVGLIGAVIGGFLASLLDLGNFHFWGTVFISFLGACILVVILQAFSGERRRS